MAAAREQSRVDRERKANSLPGNRPTCRALVGGTSNTPSTSLKKKFYHYFLFGVKYDVKPCDHHTLRRSDRRCLRGLHVLLAAAQIRLCDSA